MGDMTEAAHKVHIKHHQILERLKNMDIADLCKEFECMDRKNSIAIAALKQLEKHCNCKDYWSVASDALRQIRQA